LQLASLVERIARDFGEKRLKDEIFLDVAKAFDTVRIDYLLYTLTLLNFSSYIVYTISSYLRGRTIEASFQTATSSRRSVWSGVAQGELISPVLFSPYVIDMHPSLAPRRVSSLPVRRPSHPRNRKPTILVSYMESYFNDLERWLSEWRIAMNVSKSTLTIFALAGRRFIQPRPVTLFGEANGSTLIVMWGCP